MSAEIASLDLGSAERLIQRRQRAPFKSLEDFKSQLPSQATTANIAIATSYFEVRGRLRLDDRVLEERSLVQRLSNGQVVAVERERIASRDEQPTP